MFSPQMNKKNSNPYIFTLPSICKFISDRVHQKPVCTIIIILGLQFGITQKSITTLITPMK